MQTNSRFSCFLIWLESSPPELLRTLQSYTRLKNTAKREIQEAFKPKKAFR